MHLGLLGVPNSGLSWRRFGVLVEGLPEGSAFVAALVAQRDAEPAPEGEGEGMDQSKWSLTEQLLGIMVDVLAVANWQRGGGKSKRPTQLMGEDKPRRSEAEKPKPAMSQDEVRRVLGELTPGLLDN